jgi:hypothetical protein
MFNLKSSFFGEKSEDKAQNTALPNSFGKVRTLKEDLENFQSGKKEEEEVVTQGNPFSQNQQAPAAATLSSGSRTAPPFSPSASPSPPPSPPISSQSAAFSEKNPSMEPEKKNENPFPGSLGSSSYFERSPFENVKPVEESKPVEAAASPKSNSKTLIIVLSSVVAEAVCRFRRLNASPKYVAGCNSSSSGEKGTGKQESENSQHRFLRRIRGSQERH